MNAELQKELERLKLPKLNDGFETLAEAMIHKLLVECTNPYYQAIALCHVREAFWAACKGTPQHLVVPKSEPGPAAPE